MTQEETVDHERLRPLGLQGWHGLDVFSCTTRAEREAARDFALEQMQGERYGLDPGSPAAEGYRDPERFGYIVARDKASGKLVGNLRLAWDVDPAVFGNLHPWLLDELQRGVRVVDMGGAIDRPTGERWSVLAPMLGVFLAADGDARESLVYAQSRPFLEPRFLSLGFRPCSSLFRAAGWLHEWRAIGLSMATVLHSWHDARFHRQWSQDHGSAFDARFWRQVIEARSALRV